MTIRISAVFILVILFTFSCSSGEESPLTTDGGVHRVSCRYDNRFAGPDCKEYIGSYWTDLTVAQENCGSSFIEENAKIVAEACPDTVKMNGQDVPAKGVCHVDVGTETEYAVFSYDGPMDRLASACTGHLNGVWEALVDDETGAGLHAPLREALDALDSTDAVTVSSQCKTNECLSQMVEGGETFDFMPAGQEPKSGFVIYPAGNVDPRAYAPTAQAIAKQGVFVSIIPMENHLPLNGFMDADGVRARYSHIEWWFVGGHGLGGTMAARYGGTQTGKTVSGLILWASVAGEQYDLGDSSLQVLSLFGELDENYNQQQIQKFAHTLPADAVYICLEGGDYRRFGWYEDQSTSPATLSREQQQEMVVESTVEFIRNPESLENVYCQEK